MIFYCIRIISRAKFGAKLLCIYLRNVYNLFFSDSEINIFMEYMDGGSLDLILRKAGRIQEPYTRKITDAVSVL